MAEMVGLWLHYVSPTLGRKFKFGQTINLPQKIYNHLGQIHMQYVQSKERVEWWEKFIGQPP